MGIGTSLKDLYYHLEDRYYEVLDKINSKIPIYKIIDPIDRIIPSFAILLLLIVILLVYFSMVFFLPNLVPEKGTLTVKVMDERGNALKGAEVTIEYQGKEKNLTTSEEGLTEKFGVTVGSTVSSIMVKKEGYKPKKPDSSKIYAIQVKEKETKLEFELEEIITTKEVKFSIVDSETGQLLKGETVSLSFKCSDSTVEPPEDMVITNGTATVIVSKECGVLTADVMALGYKKKYNIPLSPGTTVYLESKTEPTPTPTPTPTPSRGKITANIYHQGERVTEEVKVKLYKMEAGASGGIEVDTEITTSGQVTFKEVKPGTYKVKNAATQNLTSDESSEFYLNAGDSEEVSLYLEERIIGHIKLRIVDKTSNAPIKDARVTLIKQQTKTQIDSASTDENGEHAFALKEDIYYKLFIDKEGYCLRELSDVEKGDDVKEIKLTRYTGPGSDCGGALVAKVTNESGEPLQGAVAMLFDEEGTFLGAKRTTDANGEAEFTGIENGKYKVFAHKGYGNGWSEIQEYKVREGIKKVFNVTLTIPTGTINVTVTNEDGEPLQYSIITVKSALTDKEIYKATIVESADGTKSFEVTAGEPVYFHIKDNQNRYAPYISEPVTVEPEAVKDLNFQLEIKRISGTAEAEFLGLFKGDKRISVVSPGKEYTARFRLSMPETADYDQVGIHVRTGYKNKMELDQIYIKEESVPGKPTTVKGISYNPGEGINYDSKFLSADGSKWMNFEWSNYTGGVIYMEFTVKVKKTAPTGSELPIFWRGWAKKGSTVLRDPEDISLGQSESQQDLYAEAYKQTFQAGIEEVCDEKWCYSAKILDIGEDLVSSVDESYSAEVGQSYKLDFSVLNNSKSETDSFHDVELQVFNPEETIEFGSYTVSGELTKSGKADAAETPKIVIGNLPINREVNGTIYFTPTKNISSKIIIRLHDPHLHKHIFEKQISLELVPAEQFNLLFEKEGEFQESPPLLTSGIENELKVRVLRAANQQPVENARVELQNRFGDTLQETTSGSMGVATLTVPIMKPGEVLFVVAEKADYQAIKKQVSVDSSLLKIEPETVGFNLNVVEDNTSTQKLKLENLTEMQLTLDKVELLGEFEGLIDEEKVHDWLYSEHYGKKIPAKGTLELGVKTELSDLGLMLKESKSLEGKLNFTVSAMGESWVFPASATISIGLGGEVDNPACLKLSKNSWTATIQEQQAVTDFTVTNTCTVKGKEVELTNVTGKIEWTSNQLGDMELKIDNIARKLRGNYPQILKGVLEKGDAGFIEGMLTFSPDGGVVGTAEGTITISAEHPTGTNKQILSDSMDFSIEIVNSAGCLRFEKDLLNLMEGEEGSFSIEATEECGGEMDIRLDTKLTVSQKEFSIPQGSSKDTTVLAESNIPGQYPIFVYAKGPGLREYSFTKLIRVIIDTEGCLKLNKYEYDIFDCKDQPYDGYDVGLLTNVCHSKVVDAEVKFSEKDLWGAFLNAWPWAVAGFVWGGINAMSEGKTFWGTDKPSTICTDAGYDFCGKGMLCKNEKIKKVKNVVCCASECVPGEEGKDLRTKLCENRGFQYCGEEKCIGEKKPVKGIYCCKGTCEREYTYAEFNKICNQYGYEYCKEGEECSKGFEWKEGVKCCTGECKKPEETPQGMVCERYGATFCNAQDGWICPAENEYIIEEEGVKCCYKECVREEEVTGKCEEEDEYYCGEGKECPQGMEHTVEEWEIECCEKECLTEETIVKDCEARELSFCSETEGEFCPEGNEYVTENGAECCETECMEYVNVAFNTGITAQDAKNYKYKCIGQYSQIKDKETGDVVDSQFCVYGCNWWTGKCKPEHKRKCSGNYSLKVDRGTGEEVDREYCRNNCNPWTGRCYPEDEEWKCREDGQGPYKVKVKKSTGEEVEDTKQYCSYECEDSQCEAPSSEKYKWKCERKSDGTYYSIQYYELGGSQVTRRSLECAGNCDALKGKCYERADGKTDFTVGYTPEQCEPGEPIQGAEKLCRPGYGKSVFIKVYADNCKNTTWELVEHCIGDKECINGECKATEAEEMPKNPYPNKTVDHKELVCSAFAENKVSVKFVYTDSSSVTTHYKTCANKCENGECVFEESSGGEEIPENPFPEKTIDHTSKYCSPYEGEEKVNIRFYYTDDTIISRVVTVCPEGEECTSVGDTVECRPKGSAAPSLDQTMPAPLIAGDLFNLGGNLLGSVNQGIQTLLGIDNPWVGAAVGWALGTGYNYFFEQEEGEFPYKTTADDLKVLSLKLLIPMGLESEEETDINVAVGETNVQSHPDYPLGVKETEIVFKNNGITQEDPYKPVFRVLKAEGEKYDYNNQFNVKKKEDAEAIAKGEFLEVSSKEGFTQKFHLQFNAYCPEKMEPKPMEPVSCMVDGMTGSTGPNALPKVRFKWNWSDIKQDTCDEGGEGIYCDATQFSIELLKRIHKVDELLRHQNFSCPSAQGVFSEKNQELSETELDVGLTKIRVRKSGKSAKVIGTIESNNDTEMQVNAVISLEKKGSGTIIECPETAEKAVQVISRSDIDCTFNDLEDGIYTARIEISPQLSTCESECKNIETANDSLETNLIVGAAGAFEKCEPYSTSRLAEFAAANPQNSNLKKATELTNFKANLIMDGYTNDFRNDFHDFAVSKSFFNTPSYYKGGTGLWKYFTDQERFSFDSYFLRPEAGYLPAGKYQVRIFIEYEDDSWSLFEEDEPNAKVTVKLDRLSSPQPDSPFYYMPFNGLVGVDTDNGRQGYGVNYRQESMEAIKVNENAKQLIRTSTIAPSTPIPSGWIYTAKSENFKTLNNDRRGVLLSVEHQSTESSIILSPSNATPVLLRVTGGSMERAWAFYSLTVGGEPQIVGPSLTSWNGFVRGCKDFEDRGIMENYVNKRDLHGGTTREGCAPLQRKSDYGLEWCDIKRSGKVFLSTVFFTPQDKEAILEMTDSQDNAVFIAPGTTGKQVYLTGVYGERIDSIEEIFELVKKEDVCVAGAGNSAKTTFFWNPRVIVEKSLGSQMEEAKNQCISPD